MKRVFLTLLAVLLFIPLSWVGWSLIAYRDIPPETLEQRYRGDNGYFLTVDGVRMLVREDGARQADAPTLLLIHSHYFDSLMWDAVVAALLAEQPGLRIVRFDMTSHGLTGPEPSGDYSMSRDVALISGLVDALELAPLVVVGSSLGGNMAFHYAAKSPAAVAGLVLINSGGLPKPQTSKRNAAAIPDWAYRILYFVPGAGFEAFVTWMVAEEHSVSDNLIRRFHQMLRRTGNRKAEMQRMAQFDSGNPDPVLAAVTAPALVLWGESNPQLPASSAAVFRDKLSASPRVEVQVVDQAGHLLPVEKPARVAAEMLEFIGGLPR